MCRSLGAGGCMSRARGRADACTGVHRAAGPAQAWQDCATFVAVTHQREEAMSIPSVLKAAVVALAVATGTPLFAQGTPINAASFDALVGQGPVADAATVAANKWASKI